MSMNTPAWDMMEGLVTMKTNLCKELCSHFNQRRLITRARLSFTYLRDQWNDKPEALKRRMDLKNELTHERDLALDACSFSGSIKSGLRFYNYSIPYGISTTNGLTSCRRFNAGLSSATYGDERNSVLYVPFLFISYII